MAFTPEMEFFLTADTMESASLSYLDGHLNKKFHNRRVGWVESNHLIGWTEIMNRSRIENISRALADGTRLRIFEEIASKKETTCSALVSMHGVTPATVSHHLNVLQEAGLIRTRRQGLFVYSSSVPGVIEAYTRSLARMVKRRSTAR